MKEKTVLGLGAFGVLLAFLANIAFVGVIVWGIWKVVSHFCG